MRMTLVKKGLSPDSGVTSQSCEASNGGSTFGFMLGALPRTSIQSNRDQRASCCLRARRRKTVCTGINDGKPSLERVAPRASPAIINGRHLPGLVRLTNGPACDCITGSVWFRWRGTKTVIVKLAEPWQQLASTSQLNQTRRLAYFLQFPVLISSCTFSFTASDKA